MTRIQESSTASSQATSGADCWGQSVPSTGYDRYGNLLTINVSKCSAPALSISVNGNNQITNSGFTYDASGDETADGLYSYTWDAENRLTSAAGVTYSYDGDGQRVKKSSGTLYWRGAAGPVLAETDTSGNTLNEYVFFGARIARRDSSGNVYYYFGNHLGSAAITNATGALCYDADFYPLGGELDFTNTCSQSYKFAAMEQDSETGEYHTLFRQYASNLGRWLTPDPSGMAAVSLANAQTWNMYAYVTNNPTTLTDATGLDTTECFEYYRAPPCDGPGERPCTEVYGMTDIMPQYTAAYAGDPTVGTSAANSPMATMMAAANQLVSTVTGFFMNAVAIPGAGNPGYQGGGEIDLGFKYLVGQLVNDFKQEGDASAAAAAIDFAIAFGAIPTGSIDPHALAALDLDLQNEQSAEATEADLKSWQTSGNSPSPSPPSAACFASYAAYMNKWGKILAAWYKTTHQPPPPGMVPPPPPHAIDPEPTGGCSIARRNR